MRTHIKSFFLNVFSVSVVLSTGLASPSHADLRVPEECWTDVQPADGKWPTEFDGTFFAKLSQEQVTAKSAQELATILHALSSARALAVQKIQFLGLEEGARSLRAVLQADLEYFGTTWTREEYKAEVNQVIRDLRKKYGLEIVCPRFSATPKPAMGGSTGK